MQHKANVYLQRGEFATGVNFVVEMLADMGHKVSFLIEYLLTVSVGG